MWKFLQIANKNLIVAIPILMVAGFVAGQYITAAPLKQLIVPFTFLMVYPMMVTLKIKKVIEGGDTKAQLLTQLINFGIIPFVAFGLGRIFFKEQPYMALGLLLAGLVPTSGMTISWTGFARGNVAAAVKMTVIGLTLGSIATPFYVRGLMGAALEVDIVAVMMQIIIVVFIPMAAGYFTQQVLVKKYGQKEFESRLAPRFQAMSTVGAYWASYLLRWPSRPEPSPDHRNCCWSFLRLSRSFMRSITSSAPLWANSSCPAEMPSPWYVRFADSIFGKSTEEIAPAGIQGSNIPEPD